MNFDLNLSKMTGVYKFHDRKNITKFAINKAGKFPRLSREMRGYQWYLKKLLKRKINIKNSNFKSFYREIYLPFFKGKQIKFWKKSSSYEKEIQIILNHYLKIGPKKKIKFVPFHGDLTFSNILFKKNNEPQIIDWEFFSKKKPWGLDICYFLISTAVLPTIANKKILISKDDFLQFKKFWRLFFKDYNFSYLRNPVVYIKKNRLINRENFLYKINGKIKKQILKAIKI